MRWRKRATRAPALVNRLLRQRNRMIAALLLGTTLVNIGGSAFTTSVLVYLTGESGAVYATIIMTVLLLVFAEVLPKTVAINHPDRPVAARRARHQRVRRRVRPAAGRASRPSCAAC